ncbi:YdeI/OmpD-associated family protein [Halomonas cupida]|uniref:YdeI/OmpD-associated family protein n=1 Tax=Halomonas cupida TaxID=44933 RepID=UPI003A9305B6
MSDADIRVEAFFREATQWREELAMLRSILLESSLEEDFKWYSPCYTHDGGNLVAIWGLKDSCALAFFKGVLLEDPEAILVAPGENSRSMRLIRFTSIDEITQRRSIVLDYVQRAIEAERSGLKVEFRNDDLDYPEELLARFEVDPQLQEAFEALTPGRRRGYILHFSNAKQSATRVARIDKCAARIVEGKGLHDR